MKSKIGHVHIKVRDVERATAFYSQFLGMKVRERLRGFVFMSGGDMHHELALQQVGPDAATPGRFDVGLFHVAFEVPDKSELARSYQALVEAGVAVLPVDHRISWAIYFRDPDGNGLELYCDTRGDDNGTVLWHGGDRELTPDRLLAHLDAES